MKSRLHDFVNAPQLAASADQALARIFDLRKEGRSVHVVTVNAEMLLAALEDAQVCAAICSADIFIPDSVAVTWWWRLHGRRTVRCAGIDFAALLLQRLGNGAFIGGRTSSTAGRASTYWQSRAAGNVAFGRGPLFSSHEMPSIDGAARNIFESSAPVVCVGFGHGKQERWIAAVRAHDPQPRVWIGVGGALDVWSGEVRRAPVFMQRLGFEWLWRVMHEPRRLGRILRATVLFPLRALWDAVVY